MNDTTTLKLTFWLESRYGILSEVDKADMIARLSTYATEIMRENNEKSMHMGLHFTMVDHDVTEVE